MNAQDLKNSILQLAIQGKLVEQREEEGTAKELLEKIKAEKEQLIKEKKIKKEKLLPEISEDEIPFEIPENWEWVRFRAICAVLTCGYASTPTYVDEKEGMPFISAQNVKPYKFMPENHKYISKELFEKLTQTCKPQIGDILLTRVGAGIGEAAIIDKHFEFAIYVSLTLIKLVDYKLLDNRFVLYWLNSPIGVMSSQKNIYGKNSSQGNLNVNNVRNFLFSLPPLEEQKRIVAKIEELMPYIEKYDKAYTKVEALNKKFPEDMQKSILQYAIQGKLVEQRNEEGTAEELYVKIQEEKEKLIKEKKMKKEKSLPEISEEEIPFEIPENWKWVRMGDVFRINPRNNIDDNVKVSFIPMTLLEAGYQNNFTYEIKEWKLVKKGFTHFKDGDIVIAKITPCFQNLKSAIMHDLENGYGAGTTELHVLRSYSELCLEYFLWFIKCPSFISNCEINMSGTAGQQRVGTDIIKNYLVPLPPLEEQKRIVAKIEEMIPYCKQLIK